MIILSVKCKNRVIEKVKYTGRDQQSRKKKEKKKDKKVKEKKKEKKEENKDGRKTRHRWHLHQATTSTVYLTISRRVRSSPSPTSRSPFLPCTARREECADDRRTLAASRVPAKRRQTSIKPTVERTTAVLYDRGALPDELARLVDLLTVRNHLDQASLAALVRNLYPSARVGDEVVLRLVGALGHGQLKPSLPLQALFLRWLVMVYHVLENPAVLSQAYAVLFNLLDTAAIRPQLCHLLALVTRRKHVRPFRIQAVLSLSRQTGGDPNLTGLLRVFKNYYPEIIVGELTRGRAAAFKHPDPQWRARLDEIQQRQSERLDDGRARNGFAVSHAIGQPKGPKALLPTVRTLHAQEVRWICSKSPPGNARQWSLTICRAPSPWKRSTAPSPWSRTSKRSSCLPSSPQSWQIPSSRSSCSCGQTPRAPPASATG